MVVLAAVVGTGFALLPRGSGPDPVSPVPSPPSHTEPTISPQQAEETRLTEALVVDTSWQASCDHADQPTCAHLTANAAWVGFCADGALARIDDTIIVVKRSDEPTSRPGRRQVALEVRSTAPGRTVGVRWFLLRLEDGGSYDVTTFGHSMVDFDTFATNLWADHPEADGMPTRVKVAKIIGR